MTCPKCNGKSRVIDNVTNNDENEIYRKRSCSDCGEIFYTCEMIVEKDETFKRLWNENYRKVNTKTSH